MTEFKSLFGTEKKSIKKTCVLVPFLTDSTKKELRIKFLSRGKIYTVFTDPDLSLIHTGIGNTFLGDAVLHLEKTPCEQIIFLGSCGLVQNTKDLKIGSLVLPTRVYSLESFSEILEGKADLRCHSSPDKDLLNRFMQRSGIKPLRSVIGASFGSLKLEANYQGFLKKNKIEVLDMESAALFAAARHIRRKAIAILYATDSIVQNPFHTPKTQTQRSKILAAEKTALKAICNFIA